MCPGRGACFGDHVKWGGQFGAVGLMFRDSATLMARKLGVFGAEPKRQTDRRGTTSSDAPHDPPYL